MTTNACAIPTLLLATTLLAGCSVGPDYRPLSAVALKVPERFQAGAVEATARDVDLATWWRQFDDPTLDWLVERSLAANLDIDAAGARLRQARAGLRGARGQALPTLGASGSATRSVGADSRTVVDPTTGTTLSQGGGDTTVYRAGFDAAWEADLFGGIRRSIEAARGEVGAAEANLHFAQLSVASEVGLNYLTARLAQRRLGIAKANLAAQDETLQIVGWRVQAGLVSSLDLEQARQLRATTAASIPTLETNYVGAINRISVLLGEAPGMVTEVMGRGGPIPQAPGIPIPIPAEVIQRRPDVASAERALAAETARIGVEKAQLYPALRLSGAFSGSDTAISNLPTVAIGSLVAAITAPIFEGGQIRAAIEGQRAATDAALAAYKSSVLTALEDVENALTARAAANAREREVAIAADAAQNAVTYARSQYRAGLIDFQSLLDSERTLLSSQDAKAQAEADRATAAVQLYKALGGGWQAAPMPATAFTATAPATLFGSGPRSTDQTTARR